MKKWLIIGSIAVVLLIVILGALRGGNKAVTVDTAEVETKDLVEKVSASGTLTPEHKVEVSANTMGKVTRVAVEEGDIVAAGDLLLEIDPTEFASAVRGYEAAVATARADLVLADAVAAKADQDRARMDELYAGALASEAELLEARTNADVEHARVVAARARLAQAQANLDRADHDLSKVTITAPMAGIVTRLNVEEGETAVVGTLNVAGTVLLEIADLTSMEAEVDVDETEVVQVAVAQYVDVTVDAYPDTTFGGMVKEIGNSPIYSATGQQRQAVDFKVTITLASAVPNVRPGLSAKAEIRVAAAKEALAVPIGAVVVREWPPRERDEDGEPVEEDEEIEREDREGVFVIEDDEAVFTPVEIGITGEEDFQVLTGLDEGVEIVVGPYQVLRDLKHGDSVKVEDDDEEES